MASCVSCDSDDKSEAGIGIVVPEYAEILVIHHGETAWNEDGRIQVLGSQFFRSVINSHCYRERVVVAITSSGVLRAFHKRAAPSSTRAWEGKKMHPLLHSILMVKDGWTIDTWGDISHLSITVVLTSGNVANMMS
ncbi:hypothetical protein Tsubulata_014836 [Turnera subulata]|uniref:Uncharacterized protein n=1 Tax=Turnera subulata TaxID=218843 RepID=A0A9Q0J855_9ROSI|nr:hypothetical protein Tsubulata_014836 [Turnera subulata]